MQRHSLLHPCLVIDIGNTNIACGIYQGDSMTWFARFFSSRNRTADEYYSLLRPLLGENRPETIQLVAMASVVPELTRIWQHLLQKYFEAEILEINACSELGLSCRVADPACIGADLIANAFGAWLKYRRNCIVVDLGTATTIQFITAQGGFEGVAIAPGLKTSADHLFEQAALLPQIELIPPQTLLGTNTRDALLSGIIQGHAFMLEAYIQRVKLHYFDKPDIYTVLTGGIAELVKPLIPSIDTVDKTLTLDGIYLACRLLKNF